MMMSYNHVLYTNLLFMFIGRPSMSLAPLLSLSQSRAICFFTLLVSSGSFKACGLSVWSFVDLASVVRSRCVTAASTVSSQPCRQTQTCLYLHVTYTSAIKVEQAARFNRFFLKTKTVIRTNTLKYKRIIFTAFNRNVLQLILTAVHLASRQTTPPPQKKIKKK